MEGVPKMAIVPAMIKKLMNGKDNSLNQFKHLDKKCLVWYKYKYSLMKRTESWPGPGGSTPRLHHKRTSRRFGIAPKLGLGVRF